MILIVRINSVIRGRGWYALQVAPREDVLRANLLVVPTHELIREVFVPSSLLYRTK